MKSANSSTAQREDEISVATAADPYRWLEERHTPECERWIQSQTHRFREYFSDKEQLLVLRRLAGEYVQVEHRDAPGSVAKRVFFKLRDKTHQQHSLFVQDETAGTERLLVGDASSNPYTSMTPYRTSADGQLLAYEVRTGGQQIRSVSVIDVLSGRVMDACVPQGKPRGLSFSTDKSGFHYCFEPAATRGLDNSYHEIRAHHFERQSNDEVILQIPRENGSKLFYSGDDENHAAIFHHKVGSEYCVDFYLSRRRSPHEWQKTFHNRPSPFVPFLHNGKIYAFSRDSAPNGKLVEIDEAGREIKIAIPEHRTEMNQVVLSKAMALVSYIEDLNPRLELWNLDGDGKMSISVPEASTVFLYPNYSDQTDEFFYSVESICSPPAIFRYRCSTGEHTRWWSSSAPSLEEIATTTRMSYSRIDPTPLQMYVVQRSDAARSQPTPFVMTAYGGFGTSVTPQFTALVCMLVRLGFGFALPIIRGGGEFGAAWHGAAKGRNRQVSIDDFTAAAQWLYDSGFADQSRLAIFGGSHAGLVVTAAMVQRPEMYRAVLCLAPLLDMLRYHKFDDAIAWASEYGTADNSDDYDALLRLSPYHNVEQDANYPATLFITGDKDVQCNPMHVRKMAALLQERRAQKHPILVDYSAERGHIPAMPSDVRIEGLAARVYFICRELGVFVSSEGI